MAKVLLADNAPNSVTSLVFLLSRSGIQVQTANNGKQALERIKQDAPDLVLLDVDLPDINGFDVLDRIRRCPDTRYLPVLMLTAHGRDVEREKGLALGASLYICKPFSTRTLIAQIDQLLSKAAAS